MASYSKPRADSFQLLSEYTKGESLVKHALAVEAAMRWYAAKFSEDVELWGQTGLLHDFDYEKYPEASEQGHPFVGCEILKSLNYPNEMIDAILGHAKYSGVPRISMLSKTLFACDELAGLVTASTLVRPDRSIFNLEVKSVKKKMKDKAFAKGVDRDDIICGAKDLNIELEEHISNVIIAMREVADEIGLSGVSPYQEI
jgi:putative nucleotidyltransferase with HDIG domain